MRRALATVVESNLAAVQRVLAPRNPLPAPAYALAIIPSDDDEELEAHTLCIGLEPDRQRALAEQSAYDAFRTVWNPGDFAVSPVFPMASIDESAAFREAVDRVVEYANSIEAIASRLALHEVARALTASPPLQPRTDDFIAYVDAYDDPGGQLGSLTAVATPAVADALRAKNLLPRDPRELEGFPRFW